MEKRREGSRVDYSWYTKRYPYQGSAASVSSDDMTQVQVRLTAEVLAAQEAHHWQECAAAPSWTPLKKKLHHQLDGDIQAFSRWSDNGSSGSGRGGSSGRRGAAVSSVAPPSPWTLPGRHLELEDLDHHAGSGEYGTASGNGGTGRRGSNCWAEVSHGATPTDSYNELQHRNQASRSGFRSAETDVEEMTVMFDPLHGDRSRRHAAGAAGAAGGGRAGAGAATATAAELMLPHAKSRNDDHLAAVERRTAQRERAAKAVRDLETRMADVDLLARPYTALPDPTRARHGTPARSGWSVQFSLHE